ncbi:efflux RND transporter periplasmic adaptor subunit [Variovorax sp. J22G21]|uniref:efflux RND transporter periplasmic adaptor subunit n=1 Tax=Variovorax fucosicus TaxID=3053517 RepID=UPI002575B567|nr:MULTISPECIES: efflux RND transporter periplasmic adaptor subunit [unclassified Variovorax]MDM0039912.1 efflux RND transporter periplasmic adaptor subunit [Variovorax sp. J22R193]MDM0064539.1 efflux RND transporter periplasmic adaptor subunit [Variovorax sp. J22G21]
MDSRPPEPQPLPPTPEVPPRRRRRWIGAVVALLLMAGVAGAAWYLINRPPAETATGGGRGGGPGGPRGPGGARGGGGGGPAITVGTAVASRADIPVMLDALGTVTPVTTVTLRPQVAGVMTDVLFKEGQIVKKGEVLARIDPRPYEQALMQARGTRVRDEAQLQAARVTLERYRTLLGQDSIARQDVDTQAALVKQLEGTVITDKAAEDSAKLNLDFTRVASPVTGRVGLRTVDPGNYVAAGATTGIAVITQMTPIDVQFSVPQDRVPEIEARMIQGAKLVVTALDRTRATTLDIGTFSTLDNIVDTTTGTVKAKARFENAKNTLFPSQFVNIKLQLRTIDGAVVVPVTALRTAGTGNYVYVINEDRTVSMRNVKRGDASVESVVITEGLKDGERVVTEGGDRLKDGSTVQLPTDAPRQRGSGAGGRRQGGSAPQGAASAPAASSAPSAAAPSGAAPAAPAAAPAAPAAARPLPTAAERQRMLDSAKDDPEQLERRKRFLESLDKGEPAALERWQRMGEQRPRREGGASQ